jgi:hypothetical protein
MKQNKIITLSNEILDSINLDKPYYDQYLNNNLMFYEYFKLKSGIEHYRLLTYLSDQFNDTTFYDIGTKGGGSALALSSNKRNNVLSYDIENTYISHQLYEVGNIKFNIEDMSTNEDTLSRVCDSSIIFIDTMHDGAFEQFMYDHLFKNTYKGLILFDDIHLNPQMEMFWNRLPCDHKIDLTKFGHATGTGLVCFNKNLIFNTQ